MKKIFFLAFSFIIVASFCVFGLTTAYAQEASGDTASSSAAIESQQGQGSELSPAISDFPADEYYQGVVEEVLEKKTMGDASPTDDTSEVVQQLSVRITSGIEKGLTVKAQNSIPSNSPKGTLVSRGDRVTIIKTYGVGSPQYFIGDLYRLPALELIGFIFFVLIVLLGRVKGFTSILGLVFSVLVLSWFVVPQILAGHDPLWISLAGALMIVIVSLYLAHGFARHTTVALLGTLITLGIAAGLSIVFVYGARLLGGGSEEALYLQYGATGSLNLQGLLLGGIIIGTLGVLDDVTIGQSTAIEAIRRANESLGFNELYRRGMAVGREHIASLVNTLALAYAGVSLPLFLLFSLNTTQPLWVILNSQAIAEELVRTFVGSIAIMLAVPITTFFSAYYFSKSHGKQQGEISAVSIIDTNT